MCSQVLELLVLQRSHRTALFASCLQAVDEGYDAHAVVPTLSGASSLQLAAFFEEERLHVKEGVVVIDEDYSSRKTASISTEARDALSLSLSLRPSPSLPLSPSRSRSRSLAPTLPPNQACDAIVHGLLPRLDSCRMMTSACRMMTSMTSCTPGGDAGSGGAGGAGGGGRARLFARLVGEEPRQHEGRGYVEIEGGLDCGVVGGEQRVARDIRGLAQPRRMLGRRVPQHAVAVRWDARLRVGEPSAHLVGVGVRVRVRVGILELGSARGRVSLGPPRV